MDKITIFLRREGNSYHADVERQGARAGWKAVALNAKRPLLDQLMDVSTLGSGHKLVRFAAEDGELPSNLELWNTHQYLPRNSWFHLLEDNTLPVECRQAFPGKWKGAVTTVDAPEVATGLQYDLKLGVTLADVQNDSSLIANRVVIASRSLGREQVATLAELAEDASASLVIWQGSGMRSSRPIVEVRTPGKELSHADDLEWLGTFIRALRQGAPPAQAMLTTYKRLNTSSKRVSPSARFLCDSIDEHWRIELPAPAVPRNWKSNVDRFAQGAMVEQLLKSLSVPSLSTRVQVVFTVGSRAACLEKFVERFVSNPRRWFEWGSSLGSQFENMAQLLPRTEAEGEDVEAMVAFVLDQTRATGNRRSDTDDPSKVCCIAQREIGFGEHPPGTRCVTGTDLSKLLVHLGAVARRLAEFGENSARLIVHLPLVIGAESDISTLQKIAKSAPNAPYLRATVLPKLSERVPAEELNFWLESYNLDPTGLHPHHEAPYEQLLVFIRNRYQLDD